jgi:hypothetical protein
LTTNFQKAGVQRLKPRTDPNDPVVLLPEDFAVFRYPANRSPDCSSRTVDGFHPIPNCIGKSSSERQKPIDWLVFLSTELRGRRIAKKNRSALSLLDGSVAFVDKQDKTILPNERHWTMDGDRASGSRGDQRGQTGTDSATSSDQDVGPSASKSSISLRENRIV